MNAVELQLPDGKPSGVWMCSKCRVLAASCHSPVATGDRETTLEERSDHARKRAERCCAWLCEQCGQKGHPHHSLCDACESKAWHARQEKRETERFAKATKLTAEEWGKSDAAGWLFDNRHDKWFSGLDDVEEWYADDGERERPAYLWCSEPVRWKPDASEYVASGIHDNCHEEACDGIPDAEWKCLDAMVNEWWERQGVVSFTPDFTRCVLLGTPTTSQGGT